MLGGAIDDGSDEGLDLGVGEGETVALVEDDVDGMDGLGHLLRRKAAGRRSAMVACALVPFSEGQKTTVLADGGGDGGLRGAGGEAVGGVFYVAAGDDGVVVEEDSGAHAEVAVGGV